METARRFVGHLSDVWPEGVKEVEALLWVQKLREVEEDYTVQAPRVGMYCSLFIVTSFMPSLKAACRHPETVERCCKLSRKRKMEQHNFLRLRFVAWLVHQ